MESQGQGWLNLRWTGMECTGIEWNTAESNRIQWGHMESYGAQWHPMESNGSPWNVLESNGIPWTNPKLFQPFQPFQSEGLEGFARLEWFPWKSMDCHIWKSMESMDFHGVPWSTNGCPWISIDCWNRLDSTVFHSIPVHSIPVHLNFSQPLTLWFHWIQWDCIRLHWSSWDTMGFHPSPPQLKPTPRLVSPLDWMRLH